MLFKVWGMKIMITLISVKNIYKKWTNDNIVMQNGLDLSSQIIVIASADLRYLHTSKERIYNRSSLHL